MTREDAKTMAREGYLHGNEELHLDTYWFLVDKIYDDFAAQQCLHCNYFQEDICCNSDSPLCCEFVSEDFGCNQFIIKD